MQKQLTHHETKLHKPKLRLVLNACLINSPANLGSIFRIAEAFGVNRIHLLEHQKQILKSNRFKRVARNTASFIQVDYFGTLEESISYKKYMSFLKIGIEITSNSKPIDDFMSESPILLFLGNENSGIPEKILQLLDQVYHISMYGINSSLNVAQSLGISLYQIRKAENINH